MIPFVETDLSALFAVVAFGVGSFAAAGRASHLGVEGRVLGWAACWSLFGALIGGHIFYEASVHPKELIASPLLLVDPRRGGSIASIGALFGGYAGLVSWGFFSRAPLLPIGDAFLFGLVPAWIFVRLGCFTAHDHPGVYTSFFLGVRYPSGTRHDLGLYESLFALGLTVVILSMRPSKQPAGRISAIACITYGVARFALDFLRLPATDPRYLGLTASQYGAVLLVIGGCIVAVSSTRSHSVLRASKSCLPPHINNGGA